MHHSRFVLCQAKRNATEYFTYTLSVCKFLALPLPSLLPVPTSLAGTGCEVEVGEELQL